MTRDIMKQYLLSRIVEVVSVSQSRLAEDLACWHGIELCVVLAKIQDKVFAAARGRFAQTCVCAIKKPHGTKFREAVVAGAEFTKRGRIPKGDAAH
jgi:hypothetical protein